MSSRAYIDIETTGLSKKLNEITVVGIAIETQGSNKVLQLVGGDVSRGNILAALEGIATLYSYNGSRFDLPFIQSKTGLDLRKEFVHKDLMYSCLKRNLKGGLKSVEKQLGITRKLKDMDGYAAILLWREYIANANESALQKLLTYNEEDIVNLIELRIKLGID